MSKASKIALAITLLDSLKVAEMLGETRDTSPTMWDTEYELYQMGYTNVVGAIQPTAPKEVREYAEKLWGCK
jgi:hypothetical protein